MNWRVSRVVATLVALLVSSASPLSQADESTAKTICLSAFGMDWQTSEDAQKYLVDQAKRDAVREIFGEMIWSVSEVQDLVLTRDELQTSSAGFIRVRGTPEFYNGSSFGETCVTTHFYLLDEDAKRLEPRSVNKKVCVADPRLSSSDLRSLAERQARIQALRDLEPGLEAVDDDLVVRLLHEARISDAGFIPDTLTYCATASGHVYPLELHSVVSSGTRSSTARGARNGSGAVVRASVHVHIVFTTRTVTRAEMISELLLGLGYDVSMGLAPDETSSRSTPSSGSLGNRLYHHPQEAQKATELRGAVRDLVSLRLMQSSDPTRSTYTLWVVE